MQFPQRALAARRAFPCAGVASFAGLLVLLLVLLSTLSLALSLVRSPKRSIESSSPRDIFDI